MSGRAQLYIAATIASGASLIGVCLFQAIQGGAITAHPAFVILAMFGAALKIRLPGIKNTISLSFLFTLIAIALLTFAETVLLASVACIVQCVWRSRTRPTLVQVCFNVAVLAIASGAAYRLSHATESGAAANITILMTGAAAVYLTIDTLLVSGVLALTQGKPLVGVWSQCYKWSFPYYSAGAVLARLMVQTNRSAGWELSLVLLIPMAFLYVFYSLCVERVRTVVES